MLPMPIIGSKRLRSHMVEWVRLHAASRACLATHNLDDALKLAMLAREVWACMQGDTLVLEIKRHV